MTKSIITCVALLAALIALTFLPVLFFDGWDRFFFYVIMGNCLSKKIMFNQRWAIFVSPAERPAILNKRHGDFWWPLSLIPRALLASMSTRPPIKLLGTAERFYDIPTKGTWALTFPLHLAIRSKAGRLFRIGERYDYVDRYYEQFAFKFRMLE